MHALYRCGELYVVKGLQYGFSAAGGLHCMYQAFITTTRCGHGGTRSWVHQLYKPASAHIMVALGLLQRGDMQTALHGCCAHVCMCACRCSLTRLALGTAMG